MKPLLLSLLLLIVPVLPAAAQDWALGGFDAVAYARAGHPVPGRSDIVTMWKGKLWHFASEDNRARFEADPRAYAPGFNGLCPVSLSEGRREKGDPRHFIILDRKLYLLRSESAERQMRAAPKDVLSQAKRIWGKIR